MDAMAVQDRLNAVDRLIGDGRPGAALAAAGAGFAEVGGAALGRRYARLAAAADRVGDAVAALRRVLETEPDLSARRDLALLQRDRLRDPDAARRTCLRGLDDPAPDGDRLARYELTTLYLRLCPVRALEDAMARAGTDRLPFTERQLARAFALGREDGDQVHAVRMFHEALAGDPYHPGGLYDLACVQAGGGDRPGARWALLTAIGDGEDRLADRFAHDADLAGLDLPADQLRRAVRGASHDLTGFQVRPAYETGALRFRIRPELRERAWNSGRAVVPGVLRLYPDPLDFRRYLDPETNAYREDRAEAFELRLDAVRVAFRGWDLHRALRIVAPLVEDTHGFVHEGNTLDEIAVMAGHLTFVRRHTAFRDRAARADLLRERARRTRADLLLAAAVAAEYGDDDPRPVSG